MLYKEPGSSFDAIRFLDNITESLVLERTDSLMFLNLSNIFYAKGIISLKFSSNKLLALNNFKRTVKLDPDNYNAIKRIILIYGLDIKRYERMLIKGINEKNKNYFTATISYCDSLASYYTKLVPFLMEIDQKEQEILYNLNMKALEMKKDVKTNNIIDN